MSVKPVDFHNAHSKVLIVSFAHPRMVDYIFSDKTGTLTQNRMEFRYMLLANGSFGSKETEIAKSVKARERELEMKKQPDYVPEPGTPWTTLLDPLLPPLNNDDWCMTCMGGCCRPCWNHPVPPSVSSKHVS